MRADLSPRDRELELERAYSAARIVGAVLALVLAPFLNVSYPAVVALTAYLGACGFGLAFLWKRVTTAHGRRRVRGLALALDIAAAAWAILILSSDLTWSALLVVPLLIFVSTLRAGIVGGVAAALALSLTHVFAALLRQQLYGFVLEPALLAFQLGLYWLGLLLVVVILRELETLQTLRAELLAPLMLAQERFGDAVLIRRADKFIFVGEAIRRITGYAPDDFARLGNITDLVPENERPAILERLRRDGPDRFETHLVHRDGRHVPVEVVRTEVARDGDTRVVAVVRDITDRRAIAESLDYTATHDALTGLPNRVFIARAIEGTHEEPLALLILDLAHFHDVSETFGHIASDELLRLVADRVRPRLRSMDVLGHIGADDFAIVLPGADKVAATRMARDLASAFSEPFDVVGRPIMTGANFGIAVRPDHGADATTLLRCAEIAVGDAVARGSSIAVFEPTDDLSRVERMALLADLQDAIARAALTVAYQPYIDVRTGTALGFEALARWEHPVRGSVSPATFIPLAEYSGLITRVTSHMLAGALAACRSWHEAGEQLHVAVNVSIRDLSDHEFPALVRELLASAGVAADMLVLEITESLVMTEPERVVATLGQLRAMGVRISLDDFGSGQSSLTQLHDLPVTQVKLDRVFAQRLGEAAGESMARAGIDLAHALGLEVVAEGVEDQATFERLAGLSCDLAQGFHIARPMPADEALAWTRARRRRALRVMPA